MIKLNPRDQEVLKYMIKIEKMNFDKSGVPGVYPNTWQITKIFKISRQGANDIINKLQEHLQKNLRQK